VITGTTENFDETISGNDYVLVEFYAPWCGHCKHLAPEYENAAQILSDEGSSIKLVKVDATIESELGKRFSVKGYPTLIFFKNGNQVPYDGDRTAAGIVNWVKRKSGPPSKLLNNDEEISAFKKEGGILGSFSGEDSSKYKNFIEVAKGLDDVVFAHTFGSSSESISVVGDNDATYDGDHSNEDLTLWIKKEGYPVLVELDQGVWTRSSNSKTTLFVGFIDSQNDDLKSVLKTVGQAYRGKLISSFMDSTQNKQLASRWGASGSVFPTAVLVSYESSEAKLFVWNEETEKEYNADTLKNFIEQSLAGTYVTNKKSEPIPDSNDEPVKVVVGKQFNDIVLDSSKDVLLEFYAPWCGHCQKLAPIYEKLGQKFAGVDTVVIAKIDATANSYPDNISIQGFPTIFLFPAGAKDTPITFEGNRDLETLSQFVVDNAKGGKIELKEDL
jgi:protein disulfide-isomerase A1